MQIVLLGAGHAHIELCRRARAYADAGHTLTLVAPDGFWYSGLATGVLGGAYPPELDRVDAAALIERGGGGYRRGVAARIDADARRVVLEDGNQIDYDLLSCNVGSVTRALPGDRAAVLPVKPIPPLLRLRPALERRFADGEAPRILIVGGGPSGCEVAANLRALADAHGADPEILLITDTRLVPELPERAARAVARLLARRRVDVATGRLVSDVARGYVTLDDGETVGFDLLIGAAGVEPPALFRASGLPVDADGALRIDRWLRSVARPEIFAAGDCAAFEPRALPKIGVFAVRQAEVLHVNLLAAAAGAPLTSFEPQRRWLLILNAGHGDGVAARGSLVWSGRLAYLLKQWLDRRFLHRYEVE